MPCFILVHLDMAIVSFLFKFFLRLRVVSASFIEHISIGHKNIIYCTVYYTTVKLCVADSFEYLLTD